MPPRFMTRAQPSQARAAASGTPEAEATGPRPGPGSSVVRSSFATFLLRAASYGVRVVCLLVMARKAGPELFGTISLLFTMAEITRVLADCGLDTLMLRNMAIQRGDELSRSIGAALCAKAIMGGTAGLVLLLAMHRLTPHTPLLNVLICGLALTPLAMNLGANYFIATRQTHLVTVPVVAITAAATIVFGIAALLPSGVTLGLAVVLAYEAALGVWLLTAAVRTARIAPVLAWRAAPALLATALPFGVALALGYTYGKADVLVLQHFRGLEEVGRYSLWSRMLDPFLFVCGVVAVTAYGHLSAAVHENDASKTTSIARRYALLNIGISGSVAALVVLGGAPLTRRLFPEYASTLTIGILLSVLLVVRSANSILTACLQAAARRKLIMVVSATNFLVTLLACVPLARAHGAVGVVSGLLIMESLNFAVQFTFAKSFVMPARRRIQQASP